MPRPRRAPSPCAARRSSSTSEGVLDIVDIERVHAMRVATRRLRAVLEIYAPCFPADELRPVLRDVKQLADALGARRDPGCRAARAGAVRGSVGPDERPGVEHFIARTRAEQEDGNRRLAAALEDVERSALRGRIATPGDARHALGRARTDAITGGAPSRTATTPRSSPQRRRRGALLADRVYGLDWSRHEGSQVRGLSPAGRSPTDAERIVRCGSTSFSPSRRGPRRARRPRAARHADRRQAPALRARGDGRAVLRSIQRRRAAEARQGPPGPARRDPRQQTPTERRRNSAAKLEDGAIDRVGSSWRRVDASSWSAVHLSRLHRGRAPECFRRRPIARRCLAVVVAHTLQQRGGEARRARLRSEAQRERGAEVHCAARRRALIHHGVGRVGRCRGRRRPCRGPRSSPAPAAVARRRPRTGRKVGHGELLPRDTWICTTVSSGAVCPAVGLVPMT